MVWTQCSTLLLCDSRSIDQSDSMFCGGSFRSSLVIPCSRVLSQAKSARAGLVVAHMCVHSVIAVIAPHAFGDSVATSRLVVLEAHAVALKLRASTLEAGSTALVAAASAFVGATPAAALLGVSPPGLPMSESRVERRSLFYGFCPAFFHLTCRERGLPRDCPAGVLTHDAVDVVDHQPEISRSVLVSYLCRYVTVKLPSPK